MNLLGTPTAEKSLAKAQASIAGEMGKMKQAQENSLNVFKKTVTDLSSQNETLAQKREMAIDMANNMQALADNADEQMSDNAKVIDKITEFLQ